MISSVWRIRFTVAELRGILVKAGFKFPGRVIGKTPRGDRQRGFEIKEWLDHFRLGVEAFVILDDDSDMEPFMDKLIQTDSDEGLTMEDVEKALKILGPRGAE